MKCNPNLTAILTSEVADKLRRYRHWKALLQREVADFADIDRSTYIRYEEACRDYYPPDKLEKIAQILGMDMVDLMDEYNFFLYHDQGSQIRAKREFLGMTIPQYARYLGVHSGKLLRWESTRSRSVRPPGSGTSNDEADFSRCVPRNSRDQSPSLSVSCAEIRNLGNE